MARGATRSGLDLGAGRSSLPTIGFIEGSRVARDRRRGGRRSRDPWHRLETTGIADSNVPVALTGGVAALLEKGMDRGASILFGGTPAGREAHFVVFSSKA
ncbi:hypothetical protein KM043_002531 [Ampulex compressa]|nr:hypothetical protein KM043_002531 [Ampulex compressa]